MDVRFVDTTFRDGTQSLWASGIRTGMIEAVAELVNRAGLHAVEVPVNGNFIKKMVRDAKEDPFAMARVLARKIPDTVKTTMAGAHILAFEQTPPRAVVELFYSLLARMGALDRAQLTSNTVDQSKRTFPWIVPLFRKLGLRITLALSYTISPRHTDEYYAQKTRELLAFNPDSIYLKDQGGLLTVDRARTLMPAILANAGGVPVELHSHCTTGLAPLVYLEALRLGVGTLHTAIPPLANGSSQPSLLNVAQNARLMGHTPHADEQLIENASARLSAIARQERLPFGAPLEYDHAQYIHQVPGGVISNLRYQLAEMRIAERLDEVLDECVRVREDLGYPIMITPHSQFVVTQAAINVATGARYQLVIDELIMFAQGVYGEDSGYTWMDQNLRDRLVGLPRAAELAAPRRPGVTLQELREKLGGPTMSDEEFLLRYIMKGEQEIAAMRAAGAPRQYLGSRLPLLTLIEEIKKHKDVRYVSVRRGGDSLLVHNRPAA